MFHSGWRAALALAVGLVAAAGTKQASAQTFEIVQNFRVGGHPNGGLVQGADGYVYGTTSAGGPQDYGTVFRMDAAGNFGVLHYFNGFDGAAPSASLLQAADGYFYGTTASGGASYGGTVFRMDASGNVVTLHEFDYEHGGNPFCALIQVDGALYGTTVGGGTGGYGTAFRIDGDGTFTIIHQFSGTDGAYPRAGLLHAADGNFYGTTSFGGDFDGGTAFRLTPSGVLTSLHSFSGFHEGANLNAAFVQGSDGLLYTTASSAGDASHGVAFRMDTNGAITNLHMFGGWDGDHPEGPLVEAPDGFFYGTTQNTVFRIDTAGTMTILHALGVSDGQQAKSGVIRGANGRFYGTALAGGDTQLGTVFSVDSAGAFSKLHDFTSVDGQRSLAGLIQAPDGFLYGTNAVGGLYGQGAVFRLNTAGSVVTLHGFAPADLGGYPTAGLLRAADGNLYGTTGTYGSRGTVFRLTPAGVFTTLHIYAVGNAPSSMIQASDGKLYGTTPAGGLGFGTVFRVNASGDVTTFSNFTADAGATPMASLIQASDGNFYGTAQFGGAVNLGTVYRMTAAGQISAIHSFDGSDGSHPVAPLIQASDGNLYGTTFDGANGLGTVFRISLSGVLQTIHTFIGTDGSNPAAALLQVSDGNLYGTTFAGTRSDGFPNGGTIFRIDGTGLLTTLHEFDNATPYPGTPLMQAADGHLYGTNGFVYRVIIAGSAVTRIGPASGPASGGEIIRVNGAGFLPSATLSVGGQDAAGVFQDVTEVDGLSPALLPGSLNDVVVGNPGSPGPILRSAYFADFLDVSRSSVLHDDVERMVRYGISAGCGGGNYCPAGPVTRAQAAVFLLKAEHGAAYVPPACAGIFADVTCPSAFANWVERLFAEGITGGCGGGNYCPNLTVVREQMAVFLLKIEHGTGFQPPACSGDFGDVPCPGPFANWIEQLADERVTSGCLTFPPLFCPSGPVSRGQMAILLTRAFHLP